MKRFQLMLALLVFAAPVAATEMYSWTDANGVKHFSDSPPPANVAKAKKLKVKGGVTSAATEEEPKPADKNAGPALAAAAGYAPEDIKRNCEIARKNLGNLETQKPALGADGEPIDAEAAKSRQTQIDKANQQIKLFCAAH